MLVVATPHNSVDWKTTQLINLFIQYDSTDWNINQQTDIVGNFVEKRKSQKSLKQHALPSKIGSNWYIKLSFKPYKDCLNVFSWDLTEEEDKEERITH